MQVLIDLFWSKYGDLKNAVDSNDLETIVVLDREIDPLLEAILSSPVSDMDAIHAQFQFAIDLLKEEADDRSCVQRNSHLLETLVERYVGEHGLAIERPQREYNSYGSEEHSDNILDEALLDAVADCVAVISPGYRVTYTNEANAQRFDLSKNQLIGRHIAEIVGLHRFQTGLKEKLDRCFQGEKSSYTYAQELHGRTVVLSIDMSPCYARYSRVAGAMILVRETADRRKTSAA